MKLTSHEKTVLIGVFRDLGRFAAMDMRGEHLPYGPRRGAYRVRIAKARAGLVPANLSKWLGRPLTASDSVVFSRVYKRLESKGLIERHGHGRTSHLSLTAEGERFAATIEATNHEPTKAPSF